MTDVLIYWRDYRQNWIRQFAGDRASMWHSNSKLLGSLGKNDHLWLVSSGANVGSEDRQAGFLVAIWTVNQVVQNPGDDPAYPRDEYRFRVVANADAGMALANPVLVDHILRPSGREKDVSIGRFLQGPRKLNENTLKLMLATVGSDTLALSPTPASPGN